MAYQKQIAFSLFSSTDEIPRALFYFLIGGSGIVIHGWHAHVKAWKPVVLELLQNQQRPSAALKVLLRVPDLERAMSHKYQPGQLVRLSRVAYLKLGASAGDLYEVTRLMPADQSGEVSYRIRSTGAGERAVCEGEITAYLP